LTDYNFVSVKYVHNTRLNRVYVTTHVHYLLADNTGFVHGIDQSD